MPKLISQSTPDAPPKRSWQSITIVLIVIIGTFIGKQALDASTRWENEAIMTDAKIQVSSAACLKEYNGKMCTAPSAPENCSQLLKCIQQKPTVDYTHIIKYFIEEIAADITMPAIVMGLTMLWRLMETSAIANKFDS